MVSAVLGLYYGSGHVFGSLFMPATADHPAYQKLLSFDGARFLTDEMPLSHGVLVPITLAMANAIHTEYEALEKEVSTEKNPFYFTEDGRPIPEFENRSPPRIATNCCHYLLKLFQQAGVPLDDIAEDLTVTFDTGKIGLIVDEELSGHEGVTYADGTVGKLKEVYVRGKKGPEMFFFRLVQDCPLSRGFDGVELSVTREDNIQLRQGIIEYLMDQPPLGTAPDPIPTIHGNTVTKGNESKAKSLVL